MEDQNLEKIREAHKFLALDLIKVTSIFCCLTNIIVFSQKIMRKKTLFQYMLVMSVSDLIYSVSMIIIVPIAMGCSWEKKNFQFENQADLQVCHILYTLFIWVSDFLTSCLAFFNIILEIFVTCQRIRLISTGSVKNQKRQKHRPLIVFTLVFAVSLAIYSPVMFMNEVKCEELRNETTGSVRKDYFYKKTAFGKSNEGLYIVESITALRVFLVIVVLTVVNIVAAVIYAAFYKRKRAMKHEIRGLTCFFFIFLNMFFKPITFYTPYTLIITDTWFNVLNRF
jgi:hypothetical protein